MPTPPNILTIAGSDSGGGAGIQADLKTIQALGGYGMSAITALTAQNGCTVTGIFPVTAAFVVEQMTTIFAGFRVHAAKTGMLFSADIIEAVAQVLKTATFPLVIDPVAVSQSGSRLLEEEAIEALTTELLPLATLLTPNIPEAEMLTGIKISQKKDIYACGEKLLTKVPACLIKGGHLAASILVTDYLFERGQDPLELPQAHIDTNNNHGTGCTLSAAIATELGKGLALEVAVRRGQAFLHEALVQSYAPGKGAGPVNHGFLCKKFQ